MEGDRDINEDRRYVCGVKKTINGRQNDLADHFSSKFCNAPGGQDELSNVAERVNAFLDTNLPLRPNGQPPKQCHERTDRSRSKSRSKGSQRDDDIKDK